MTFVEFILDFKNSLDTHIVAHKQIPSFNLLIMNSSSLGWITVKQVAVTNNASEKIELDV